MENVERGKHLKKLTENEYREKLQRQILRNCEKTEDGCWIWASTKTKSGYGLTRVYGKQTSAHRAAYFAFKGQFDKENDICHSCDVRECVNPDHLFADSHANNMLDMKNKGRSRNGVMSGVYATVRNELGQFVEIKNGKS